MKIYKVGGAIRDSLLGEKPKDSDWVVVGSSPEEITLLRQKAGKSQLIWTPGVNIETLEGDLGQRYGHPYDAIKAGSDGVIVGSGIYGSDDPVSSAKLYAKESWRALVEREDNG